MLYIFDKDDNFKNIITEDTGLIDTWFKDYQNHLIDEPFVFHVESESELLPLIVAENQVAFKHTFNALQQDVEMLKLMRIKEIDEIYNNDGYIVEVTCDPSWLELEDHFIEDRRIENGTSQTAMNRALQGSRWVGQVAGEFGNGSTNFYWIDAVEALFKIAEEWGGTLQDYITLDENNEIATRIMYLLPRLGRDNGLLIQPGYNAETIERRTLSYPVTAIWGQGASLEIEDDEGQHTGGYTRYITFEDVEWSKAKGDPVDKPKGQKWVGDPDALAKYGYKQVERVYLLEYTTLETGTLTANAGNETSAPGNNRIRSGFIDFVDSQDIVIDAIPSTDIQINVYSYDSSERFISHSNYLNLSNNIEYTLPVNARYVRFVFKTINNEIITVSNIRDISIRFNFFDIMHRFGHFSNQDYETPEELLYATWEALQKEKEPEVYHEAVIDEVDKPIFLGDTGTILDRHYGKPIEVQSQITGLEYDILEPTKNVSIILGNYKDMSRDPLEDEIDEIKKEQSRPPIINDNSFPDVKPGTPVNVEAVGMFRAILISWEYDSKIYMSHYEVYASQTADFVPDDQFLVYRGRVSSFGHEVGSNETWYYRVRAVNTHGTTSEFSVEVSASSTRIDFIDMEDEIKQEIQDTKDRAEEAYGNANIATENAIEAIGLAQDGFDKSLEAINELTTLTEFVDDNTGTIATIKGDVQGLQTTVSKKVDESTFSTFVQQTNNSIAGKISMADAEGVFVKGTTFSATIDGLQTTVSNKADKSTVTQLAGVVDTKISTVDANNKFATQSQLTQTSSSLTSTITSVKNDLDGLEIGGRNLIPESSPSDDSYWYVTGEGRVDSGISNGELFLESDGSSWTSWRLNLMDLWDEDLEPDTDYTFSYEVKVVSAESNAIIRPFIRWYTPDGSHSLFRVDNHIPKLEKNKWHRVHKTDRITSDVVDSKTNILIAMEGNTGGSFKVYFRKIQLEKGNVPTDWSPAPEDMATQSQISQLSDAINLRVKEDELITQINLDKSGILISGKKLILDGDTTVTGNFRVNNANIVSVDAGKMTTGTLDAARVNVININANNITSGTVDTDLLTVRGGSTTEYAQIDGAEIETRGKYTRTWFGETKTHDVGLQLRYGRLRFRNYDSGRNLYFSETGISTYLGGSDSEDGGNYGSGTIEFFSHRFDSNVRGLTLYSNNGSIGLETETRDIYLDAYRYNVIRARTGYVSINPHIDNRPGNNTFRFNVKNRESSADTDGTIIYGSTAQSSMASGIRFKKSRSGEPLIWATDGSGEPASGSFYGRRLYGDLMPRGSFAYVRAPRLRVIDHDSNTNTYGDVQGAMGQMYTLRVNLDGDRTFDNFYIGVSSGELRVVNNATISEERFTSDPTYRPVRARSFIESSSRTLKTDIKAYEENAMDVIRSLTVVNYRFKDDVERGVNLQQIGFISEDSPAIATADNTAIQTTKLASYLTKGLQETDLKIDLTREELILKISKLEDRLSSAEQKISELESAA